MKTGRYVWDKKKNTWVHVSESKKQKIDVAIGAAGYPFYSDALGVHPNQVQEEMEAYRKAGVPTEIAKNGQVKIESRPHHKAVLKVAGFHERSSCRLGGRECA